MEALRRTLKHLWFPDWQLRQRLPERALRDITEAIRDSETRHRGEIRFAVEASLPLGLLLRGESAANRALDLFSALRVWDTEHNSGVLIYLLLADRDVEIVADRGLNGRVSPQEWEAICKRMEKTFGSGEFEAGTLAAIAEIGDLLADRLPSSAGDRNELPDRPVLL